MIKMEVLHKSNVRIFKQAALDQRLSAQGTRAESIEGTGCLHLPATMALVTVLGAAALLVQCKQLSANDLEALSQAQWHAGWRRHAK